MARQGKAADGGAQDAREELAYLRSKINSLVFRGDYPGAIKMIDGNMRKMYENERWPDSFFTILRVYQRCYPSLNKAEPFEEHIVGQLKKNGIPTVFATLLRGSDSSIVWSAEYFKDLAVVSEGKGDFETALSYSDLVVKIDPGSAGARVVRGWILDDLDRPEEAEEMFLQALELNDSSHSAHNALAKHYAEKKPKEALAHIDKAIEAAPHEGSYYDTKAQILTRLGDTDGALACYDLAMEASPYEADYPYRKAELLLSDGKEMLAITNYRRAMALNEQHVPSLWRLARLYRDNQPDLALTYVNTILSLEEENRDAMLLRAALLAKLGQESAAAEQYRQFLALDENCHEALGGYAALMEQNDPEAAVEYYDKAIAIAPKIADYHFGKGRAHEKLDQGQFAAKEYRATISLDKKNAKAHGRLGIVLSAIKPKEALESYAKAAELDPGNPQYLAAKAEMLVKTGGDKNEAIACLGEAVKYDPSNARLRLMLAQMLEKTGSTASATEQYKQAVALDARNPEAFFSLAKLTFATEPEAALLYINSALSLDAMNGELYYFKSKILNRLGHDTQALNQLEASLSASPQNAEALAELSELKGSQSPRVALHYINKAIKLNPENLGYICLRANLLFGMEEYEKARSQYAEILSADPKNSEALFGLGRCLAKAHDAKALEYYDKAIAVDAKIPEYHAEKAKFLEKRGEVAAAIASYDAAIALDTQNWRNILAKAQLLEAEDRIPEACDEYKRVLLARPECSEAVWRLGRLLAEEHPQMAREYLSHAVALAPDDYIRHAWLGRVLLTLGDKDAAAAAYKCAAELGGETAETHFTLAEILADKMPEAALGYCLRALEEDGANADYNLLCGKLYRTLGAPAQALERLRAAHSADPGRHAPQEAIAELMVEKHDPAALEALEAALQTKPDCAPCLLMRVNLILAQEDEDRTDEAIACLDRALGAAPGFIPAREKLVELLAQKKSYLRLMVEKRKLNREKGKAIERA